MLESKYLAGRDDLLGTLRRVPFLRSYEDRFLRRILELSKMRKYRQGEVITREGEYDSWLYVILSGEVTVVKNDEQIARIDARVGTFGELSVIDGEPRSASTFAAVDTTCLTIDGSIIDRLESGERQEFEAVYYRLLSEILAHRLRQTSGELSRLKQQMELLGKV